MSLKLIVFDIGGTVFSKGKKTFIDLLTDRLTLKKQTVEDAIDGPHSLYYRRGQITADEYWNIAKAKLSTLETKGNLERLWFDQYIPIDGMPKLLAKLRKKYKLAYLSNNVPERVTYLEKKYHFLSWFDGGIFSYEAKKVKSDGGLYQVLLQKFPPISPQETLIIDDKRENLLEPENMGFQVLIFVTLQKLENQLEYSTTKTRTAMSMPPPAARPQ